MQYVRINLKDAHDKTNLSSYAVAQRTDVAENTVRKYAEKVVISKSIPLTAILLADFYGVNWRDPQSGVIQIIDVDEEGDESPEEKTPLAASA